MKTSFNKFLFVRSSLAAIVFAFVLAGCGGGGSGYGGGGSSSHTYTGSTINSWSGTAVSWIGNANGTVIYDYGQHLFKVDSVSRNVVDVTGGGGTTLTGLTVDTSANVIANGTVIGGVYNANSVQNTNIVVFKCGNGSNTMTIVVTSGWSITCP